MLLYVISKQSLFYTYLLLTLSFVVQTSHLHKPHSPHSHLDHHNARFSNSGRLQHFGGESKRGVLDEEKELLSNSSQSTADIDIATFIDDFVDSWVQDPTRNSTQQNLPEILATANRVKQTLLNPASSGRVKSTTNSTQVRSRKRSSKHHLLSRRYFTTAATFTNSTLEEARAIVRLAQKEANARNKERIDHPRVNNYYGYEKSKFALKSRAEDASLLAINSTVAAAAAMVAEADAAQSNRTVKDYSMPFEIPGIQKRNLKKRAGSFWMEDIEHNGLIPFGGTDNDNYVVFRNVKDYGAVGDGKTDDTAAINRAMTDGNRCGAKCGASSVKGAVLYFPFGDYLISSTIEMYYNTQMVGDPSKRPILTAAKSFVGLGLLSSDHYTGNNGGAEEWYINQNNFYRQVRNFIIDVRQADMVNIAGIHWQVAQATSIQDVSFFQSKAADKSHMGIFAENGSGGFMSDLTFIGGAIGIRCGNQQFTTRNFVFISCTTAIDMLWDWGWTWKSLYVWGCDVGIKMSGDYIGGSIFVLDSKFFSTNIGISISATHGSTVQEQFSVTLDNLVLTEVATLIDNSPSGIKVAGGSRIINSWTLGKVYDSKNPSGTFQTGDSLSALHPITSSLYGDGDVYLERSKPQYEDYNAEEFINAKISVKGDGSTDDTFGLNLILSIAAAAERPLFIPMGSYIVTDTIFVPVGSRIVGECWSQIVATGGAFISEDNPWVMVQVGTSGSTGIVEIQDLLFTSVGPTAGVVLMEWNVAQSTPGSAAMWDSHFRIGGAKGTNLQARNCPKLGGSINQRCIAGSMLLHLTKLSSAYMENIWAWVADHDIDSSEDQTQIDVYVARGILIESQGPSWLYGTSSEHCVLYQYQLFMAKNIFLGMIQTESPYYLPAPQAPAPFAAALGKFNGDPSFSDCDNVVSPHCAVSWALRIVSSSNIHIAGAGLYNWFQAYIQPCVDAQNCAQRVVEILQSSVWMYNLYTIGTEEMITTRTASPILAKDNTNKNEHPFTSIVNAWLLSTSSIIDQEEDDSSLETAPDPPCTAIFTNITQVVEAVARIPSNCLDRYLVDAEIATTTDTLDNYTKIISDDYDKKFKIYERYIKELVPQQIKAYMAGAQASGFFTCTTTKVAKCCALSCCSGCTCPDPMICDVNVSCPAGRSTLKIDCPTTIPDPGTQTLISPIAYTCTNVDGFKADLAKKYGIDPEWITFGDYTARINGGCWMQTDPDCGKDTNTIWTGFPQPIASFSVPDPKSLISGTYDNTRALVKQLSNTEAFMDESFETVTRSDLVDAASVPALMTYSAVQSMSKVVELADKITAEERKQMILNFVMAILMLIPGVGEIADAAGMAALRTFIHLLGNLGEIALGIHGIVEDPKSAVFAVFGLLLTGAGSGKSFEQAATARRGFTSKDLETLAPIRGDLDKISNARAFCLARI